MIDSADRRRIEETGVELNNLIEVSGWIEIFRCMCG